ncbi:MAG: DNA-3-methyladenine glycosylase [Thermoanaerobaculia bacterium]|jgi:DNA-3-methyladenine glycosylase
MGRFRTLPARFFRRPAEEVAAELLGRFVVRDLEEERLVLRIVEVEAYLGARDRASHAWQGRRTERNKSLYADGGVAYVYFIYGMHYCLNVVTGRSGNGDAVLLRAGEPIAGAATMLEHRRLSRSPRRGDLAGGPGKLCQALNIDRDFDGSPLTRGALRITEGEGATPEVVVTGPRIGIAYAGEAADWPLRYAIRGNRHVSRPLPWSK